jgi:hypothetical protein
MVRAMQNNQPSKMRMRSAKREQPDWGIPNILIGKPFFDSIITLFSPHLTRFSP